MEAIFELKVAPRPKVRQNSLAHYPGKFNITVFKLAQFGDTAALLMRIQNQNPIRHWYRYQIVLTLLSLPMSLHCCFHHQYP